MMRQKKPAPEASKPTPSASPPSLVSPDVRLEGSLVSDGDVQLDGTLSGDVRARNLVIGEGAVVEGAVRADHLRLCGTIKGTVRARRVELAATAVIEGDVLHAALSVEPGARLDGKVCCLDDPLAEKARGFPAEKVRAELAERQGEAAPKEEKPAAKAKAA